MQLGRLDRRPAGACARLRHSRALVEQAAAVIKPTLEGRTREG
jgi:hypothetical protein